MARQAHLQLYGPGCGPIVATPAGAHRPARLYRFSRHEPITF